MDKEVRRSEAQNYDGERQMKILDSYSQIAKLLYIEAEVPDDKPIKYKKKDGEDGETRRRPGG